MCDGRNMHLDAQAIERQIIFASAHNRWLTIGFHPSVLEIVLGRLLAYTRKSEAVCEGRNLHLIAQAIERLMVLGSAHNSVSSTSTKNYAGELVNDL